jgi:hypothetical protein
MSGKAIKFGVEGRAAMLKGVETLADAVQVRFLRFLVTKIPSRTQVPTGLYENTGIFEWIFERFCGL